MNKAISCLTIGIPIYNGEFLIKKTIESLLKQSFTDFDVILYDDGSKDNSIDLINSLIKGDDRFHLIKGIANIGNVPSIMKEIIFPNAKGKYFMYMSQDDFLETTTIAKAVKNIEQTQSDISLFNFIYYNPNHSNNKMIIGYYGDINSVISGKDAFLASLDWDISAAGIYKRELIEKVGYFDFNMYADEYSARMFMLNANLVSFNDGVFNYNIDNPDAITKKMRPELFSKLYKETLLFLAVVQNFENKIVKTRFEKIVQMFYDYRTMLKNSDFKKNEYTIINKGILDSLNLIKNQNINLYKFNLTTKLIFKSFILFKSPLIIFKTIFLKQ